MNQKLSSEGEKQKRLQILAIVSLIIGILMIIATLVIFYIALLYVGMSTSPIPDITPYIIILILFGGVFSGIIGLRSNRKKYAITGIILSSLLLILYLFMVINYVLEYS